MISVGCKSASDVETYIFNVTKADRGVLVLLRHSMETRKGASELVLGVGQEDLICVHKSQSQDLNGWGAASCVMVNFGPKLNSSGDWSL
jgi:hypothetical protein